MPVLYSVYLSYLGKFVFVDKFLEVEGILGPSCGGEKSLDI